MRREQYRQQQHSGNNKSNNSSFLALNQQRQWGGGSNQQQRPSMFNRGISFQWLYLLPSTTKQRQRQQPQQERLFFEEQEQEQEQPTFNKWFSQAEQKPNSTELGGGEILSGVYRRDAIAIIFLTRSVDAANSPFSSRSARVRRLWRGEGLRTLLLRGRHD